MDLHDAPRTCPKCKQRDAIPASDSRLSCPSCREKQRNYYYRAKERESATKKIENDNATSTVIKSLKRKREPSTVEYQSADGLYKALRKTLRDATSSAAAAHRMPSFRGCFSIVADPSVNHLDRARAVTKDVKKKVKYPLANVSRDKASDSSDTFARITADCRCLTLIDVAGSSSSSSTSRPVLNSFKNGAGASSRNVDNGTGNEDKLVEALEASFERNCGGKVKISVKGDFSHPLGISGQKVIVKVVH